MSKEQETISQERAGRSAGGSTGTAGDDGSGTGEGAAAEGMGESGEPGAAGEDGSGSMAKGRGSEGNGPGEAAGGSTTTGSQGGVGGGARGGAGPGEVPAGIPDGRDDDIVARQLREAAMKETDPELRERLWDEYRKYKQSTQ
jgi:hypothetical protein